MASQSQAAGTLQETQKIKNSVCKNDPELMRSMADSLAQVTAPIRDGSRAELDRINDILSTYCLQTWKTAAVVRTKAEAEKLKGRMSLLNDVQ